MKRETKSISSCVIPKEIREFNQKGLNIYLENLFWESGNTILVFFLDQTNEKKNEMTLTIAKYWENAANIKFEKTDDIKISHIRVSYMPDLGSFSALGKACLQIPFDKSTMNLDQMTTNTEEYGEKYINMTLHQFGHALGFEHQLQYPFYSNTWDCHKIYEYQHEKSKNWVDENVILLLDIDYFMKLQPKFDSESIMCFHIDPVFFSDEFLAIQTTIACNKANGLSFLDQKKARHQYSFPLFEGMIGEEVKVKCKSKVLSDYTIVERSDYFPWMDKQNDTIGKVDLIHQTNGVRVKFYNGTTIWYEPESLEWDKNIYKKISKKSIRRLQVGTQVKIVNGQCKNLVGRICLHFDKNYNQCTVSFADQKTIKVEPEFLLKVDSFFGQKSKLFYNIDQNDYPLGSTVKVKPKQTVLESYEFIGRSDYFEQMDIYCGQPAVIDLLHPTNGIRVKFNDSFTLWYEPGSLEIIKPGKGSFNMIRLPTNTLVKVTDSKSKYHNQVGKVMLHFLKEDYSKITVIFQDQFKEYLDPSIVIPISYYF